jgi:hypothetical protein
MKLPDNTREVALVDCDVGVQHRQHPAEKVNLLTGNNETSAIQIYTDGSNSEQGV